MKKQRLLRRDDIAGTGFKGTEDDDWHCILIFKAVGGTEVRNQKIEL